MYECIPSLWCLLFCHAGPEKSSTLIYRCRPTVQTLLECFVRPIFFTPPNRGVQWNCIYSLWVRPAHQQYWSFTKLCSRVFSGRISYEFGNFKLSVYRNGTMVRSWKWWNRIRRVHGSGQILSQKYCHVEEQEDENCHFMGVTATKSLRNTTKHVKLLCLARFDLPFPPRVSRGGTCSIESHHCGSAIQIAANTVSLALRLVVLVLYHCNSVVFVVRGP